MWQYIFFRLGCLTIARCPRKVGYLWATLLGDLAYFLGRRQRRVVTEHMRQALGPEASSAQIQRAVRHVFRNAAKNYLDILRLPYLKPPYFDQTITIHGEHYFHEALARGKGVIIATAHLGNPELTVQVAAGWVRLTILAEPLRSAPLFRLMTQLRESQGLSTLPATAAGLKTLVRRLRQGEVVAVACDRDLQGKGIPVEFLGRETLLPTGAIDLALMTEAALLPTFNVRREGEHFSIYVEPPLNLRRNGSRQESVAENVRSMASVLERYIRWHPDQWVVFAPLWGQAKSSGGDGGEAR